MESNIVKLLNGLEGLYPENTTISQIKRILVKFPGSEQALADAYSIGQIESKQWLVAQLEILNLDLGTIFLCAGWYATLAHMLFQHKLNINKIRSFDIDESCAKIAEIVNKEQVKNNWKFKASTLDIKNLEYDIFSYSTHRYDGSELTLTDTANTIINTSCEHITDFADWYNKIPKGKIIILQTNNYSELPEHINCSESLEHFSSMCPMTTTLYTGELPLAKYTRYMKIGIK